MTLEAMKREYLPIHNTFERLASSYSRSTGMEEVNRRELAPVAREWDGRILDVGAGAGAFIEKYMNPSKNEITAVDFSFNMIEETRMRLESFLGRSLFLSQALAQALPFKRDSFDAALSVNTLHNMPSFDDVAQALSEMARVVRPRGLILAEFRNLDNPQRRRICELHDHPELPQKAYTFEQIEQAFSRMGFEVERRIPLWGDVAPEGPLNEAIDRLKKSFGKMQDSLSPRFAVVARKGPGFRSVLRDALGVPVVE
ncbi:MAG: methyltransferase domain-containing protein [bacterium]